MSNMSNFDFEEMLATDDGVNIVRLLVNLNDVYNDIVPKAEAQGFLLGDKVENSVERLVSVIERLAPKDHQTIANLCETFSGGVKDFAENPIVKGAGIVGSGVVGIHDAYKKYSPLVLDRNRKALYLGVTVLAIYGIYRVIRKKSWQKVTGRVPFGDMVPMFMKGLLLYVAYQLYMLKDDTPEEFDPSIMLQTLAECAEQSQPEAQNFDFDGEDDFGVLGSSIITLMGLSKYVGDGERRDFFQTVNRSVGMKNGLTSTIKDITRALIKLINFAWRKAGHEEGLIISSTGELVVDKLRDECYAVFKLYNENKFDYTGDNLAKLQSLLSRMNTVMQRRGRDGQNAFTALRDMRSRIEQLLDKFYRQRINSSGYRTETTCIVFEGKPGTGKSTWANLIARYCVLLTLETEEQLVSFNEHPDRFIYNRIPTSEFYDGYTDDTRVTTLDEFGQIRDSIGMTPNPFVEFIMMKNCFPMGLNMAGLDDKGRKFFRSEFIVATTNRNNWNLNSIFDSGAVTRRFDIHIEVRVKPEYADKDGKIDPKKLPTFDGLQYPDPDTISDLYIHKPNGLKLKITFQELLNDIKTKYEKAKLVKLSNEAMYAKYMKELEGTCSVLKDRTVFVDTKGPESQSLQEEYMWHNGIVITMNVFHSLDRESKHECVRYKRGECTLVGLQEPGYYYPLNCSRRSESKLRDLIASIDFDQPGSCDREFFESWLAEQRKTISISGSDIDHMSLVAQAVSMPRSSPIPLTQSYQNSIPGSYGADSSTEGDELSFLADMCDIEDEYVDLSYESLLDNTYGSIQVDHFRFVRYLINQYKVVQHMEAFAHFNNWDCEYEEAWCVLSYAYSSVKRARQCILALKGRPIYFDDYRPLPPRDKEPSKIEMVIRDSGVPEKIRWLYELSCNATTFVMESPVIKFTLIIATGFTAYQVLTRKHDSWVDNSFTDNSIVENTYNIINEELPKVTQSRPEKNVTHASSSTTKFIDLLKAKSAQGVDSSGQELIRRIAKNVISFWMDVNGVSTVFVYATVIAGTICVGPCHTFKEWAIACVEKPEAGKRTLIIKQQDKQIWKGSLGKFCASGIDWVEGIEKDFIFWKLPREIPSFKDIVDNFISEDQVHKLGNGHQPTSLELYRNGSFEVHHTTGTLKTTPISYKENSGAQITLATSYVYRVPSIKGDCGIPICVNNKALGKERIISIHVGGYDAHSLGFGTIVTQENIRSMLKTQFNVVEEKIELGSAQGCPLVLNNYFDVLGAVEKGLYRNFKTALEKSPLHDQHDYHVPRTMITIKRPNEEFDPFDLAMKKYLRPIPEIDEILYKKAYTDLRSFLFSESTKQRSNKPWSILKALYGDCEDASANSIPSSTSAGYPMSLENNNLKSKLFQIGGDRTMANPHIKELQEEVDKVLSKYRTGIRAFFVYAQQAKDERLPIEKVMKGKLRLFNGAPFILTVLFRIYFGEFIAWIKDNRIDNSICIGLNVYSNEWHALAERLKAMTPNGDFNDGDFSQFDGSIHSVLLWMVYDLAEEFYKNAPHIENQYRFMLWHEIVFSKNMWLTFVYALVGSNPSGNVLTTIINSLVVLFLFRLCYYQNEDAKAPFHRHVALQSYGDDSIFAASPAVSTWFNGLTLPELMANVGMTYTSADKESVPVAFKPLSQIQFLKRFFQYQPRVGRYIAPMEVRNALEICQWTRKKTPTTIFLNNIVETLEELSLCGEEIFLEKRKYLKEISASYDQDSIRNPVFTDRYIEVLNRALGREFNF